MNWDKYFYEICLAVAKNSKCHSRQIGTILVRDKSIISTGYNGPAKNIPTCDTRYRNDYYVRNKLIVYYDNSVSKVNLYPHNLCPRQALGYKSGEGLDICVAVHAEVNCLLTAAKNGISTKDTIMYLTVCIPCKDCLAKCINAGISEIVVTTLSFYDPISKYIVNNSNIKIRDYDGNYYK